MNSSDRQFTTAVLNANSRLPDGTITRAITELAQDILTALTAHPDLELTATQTRFLTTALARAT